MKLVDKVSNTEIASALPISVRWILWTIHPSLQLICNCIPISPWPLYNYVEGYANWKAFHCKHMVVLFAVRKGGIPGHSIIAHGRQQNLTPFQLSNCTLKVLR
ncbi:unnamed protein product [Urochloa humidicola]